MRKKTKKPWGLLLEWHVIFFIISDCSSARCFMECKCFQNVLKPILEEMGRICRCSTIRILWITICIRHRQGALLPCPKIRKRRVVLPSSSQQQMTERVSRHCAFTSTRLNVCLIRAETFQSTFLSSCESFVWDYFMARLWNHHPQTNKTTT